MNGIQFGFPERDKFSMVGIDYPTSTAEEVVDQGWGWRTVQIRCFQIFQIFSNIMELNSKNIQFLYHVKM